MAPVLDTLLIRMKNRRSALTRWHFRRPDEASSQDTAAAAGLVNGGVLGALVDRLIAAGVHGLFAAGTTGEGPLSPYNASARTSSIEKPAWTRLRTK